jgi:hypothetical protein
MGKLRVMGAEAMKSGLVPIILFVMLSVQSGCSSQSYKYTAPDQDFSFYKKTMPDAIGVSLPDIKGMLVRYVDPFIGTGGHGHLYPGATLPFGMVQVSPDNEYYGWDRCSGYHWYGKKILGFPHKRDLCTAVFE